MDDRIGGGRAGPQAVEIVEVTSMHLGALGLECRGGRVGAGEPDHLYVDSLASAPADASPLELISSALTAITEFFPDDRRTWSRQRQAVIALNPPLKERELLKMARMAEASADALRARGIPDPAATLAAESGVTVFTVAFLQWIADGETRTLAEVERATLTELNTFATGLAGTGAQRPR
jgi:hypothetical protein